MDASKDPYLDFKTCLPLIQRFEGCIEIDKQSLKPEFWRANIIIEFGKSINRDLYSNLQKIFKISKTNLESTAAVERRFSAMNRILSSARNSLSSFKAGDFMVLSMNKDLLSTLDLDKVLNRWVKQKERIAPFS